MKWIERVKVRGTPREIRGDGGSAKLWIDGVPSIEGEVVGCIGEFEARDEVIAAGLLEVACAALRHEGCTLALGPMDGNTWRSHRLVTWRGGRPPFFLEPWNPPEWPEWWGRAGFADLAAYRSSRFELIGEVAVPGKVEARLAGAGVTIRPLRLADFEGELQAIHEVCLEAFADNYLYTPLSRDEFVTMYAKVRPLVKDRFVWIAEVDGRACGFVFGLPDALATGRGEEPDFIVKTLAVLPERRFAGLGSVLVGKVQAAAREAGFRHAIHALQHQGNSSRRITDRHGGELLRRYALYSKSLR